MAESATAEVASTQALDVITADNYQEAYYIQTHCHAFPWSEKIFLDCLTKPYFAFQLRHEQMVVGYFVGLAVSVEATLMDIGVSDDFQGRGYGRALLKAFLLECHKRQLSEAWLEVRVSNTKAIELYQSTGFEVIEQRKDYYPALEGKEDALIMKLELGA